MKKQKIVRGLLLIAAGIAFSAFWFPALIVLATAIGLLSQAIQIEV